MRPRQGILVRQRRRPARSHDRLQLLPDPPRLLGKDGGGEHADGDGAGGGVRARAEDGAGEVGGLVERERERVLVLQQVLAERGRGRRVVLLPPRVSGEG